MLAYRCPICASALDEGEVSWRCPNGHVYDRAREGYVNLLRSGRLKGREPGDSDEMIRARRAVFDAGLYAPLIDAVAASVARAQPAAVLDVGCGEGSYLLAAAERAGCDGWGIDISKAAVRLAKRSSALRYAVASAADLPFFDASFDAVISVFSPREFAEMRRVLKCGGIAVVASPGPRHLREVKAALYDTPLAHDDVVHPWAPLATEHVATDIDVPSVELRRSLLQMTPFWWSAPAERADAFVRGEGCVRLDVRIDCYRLDDPSTNPRLSDL